MHGLAAGLDVAGQCCRGAFAAQSQPGEQVGVQRGQPLGRVVGPGGCDHELDFLFAEVVGVQQSRVAAPPHDRPVDLLVGADDLMPGGVSRQAGQGYCRVFDAGQRLVAAQARAEAADLQDCPVLIQFVHPGRQQGRHPRPPVGLMFQQAGRDQGAQGRTDRVASDGEPLRQFLLLEARPRRQCPV